MPYRAWLLIAALGLIVAASLGQAQEQAQEAEWQTEPQQGPAQSLPRPFPIVIVEDDAAAEARQRQEEESRQREIEDLIAQQGMNAATQAMNAATQDMRDYALYSTIFIGIGTVLLVVTLYLTGQANRAAVESVAVTRRIGEAQTRAYLSFDSIDAGYIAQADGEITGIRLRPNIRNTGQTPAYIRMTWGKVFIQAERPTKINVVAASDPQATLRVGAQKCIFLSGGDLRWDDVREAIHKNHYIILICGVEFEDVFFMPGDKRRDEDFAVRVVFNGRLTDPRKPYTEQPTVEWHDLQLNVSRASPPENREEQ